MEGEVSDHNLNLLKFVVLVLYFFPPLRGDKKKRKDNNNVVLKVVDCDSSGEI